jgi:4-amino-4-deoxy-L-arabinose transferase-like glycosyltransferase
MHEAEARPVGALAPRASVGVSEAPREVSPASSSLGAASEDGGGRSRPDEGGSSQPETARSSRRLGLATMAVLAVALAVLVPTVGDLGLTWDEPAYRYSQLISVQWWEQLGRVRSLADAQELLDPTALLYYWPYGRHGINFHPPLAGQLNLATYEIFGRWMKDIPARRMASVIEFALTITIGFHFLARRYGFWAGAVMAGSLLLMPRLYGQAHLIDTDTPGLLLWAATALAFWKGLHEPNARRWRVAVGILLGLAFVEKVAAVMVLLPLIVWLDARALARPGNRAAWIDGLLTSAAMLAPMALVFQQILALRWPFPASGYEDFMKESPKVWMQMLHQYLPPPQFTNLFVHQPAYHWTGALLAIPMGIWFIRRLLGWLFPRNGVWGVERPGLETWTAILAFAPVVGWLGNPAWWRETIPRLAHYYTLSMTRKGVLPDIEIIYFGQIYEFSLPWHNAFVLMGITVPAAILGAAAIGLIWGLSRIRRDWLPWYFLIHLLTLPIIRMFPTPAHDGVRLFLPSFFFLAAFAGWGTVWLADALSGVIRVHSRFTRPALASLVLATAALALIRVHPYELSYYNELIGGPRGAWERGFELTYWYDAFNGPVVDELNRKFPPNARVGFLNDKTLPVTFQELQTLGAFRGDLSPPEMDTDQFSYAWLLTQDSKSSSFTRLLFAMRPWYASEPRQLDGARVASVADPVAVSRAWALRTLLDAPDRSKPDPEAAPAWVQEYVPWLGRLWGDGLEKAHRLALNQTILDWSRSDPEGLLAAARQIASRQPIDKFPNAQRLYDLITTETNPNGPQVRHYLTNELLRLRPQALVEAIQILNAHRDEVVKVMTRYGYTDPKQIDGFLDRDLPTPEAP